MARTNDATGLLFFFGANGWTDHACIGDRKRLLLYRLHITLQESVVERVIYLGRAFELGQSKPIAVGELALGYQAGQRPLQTFFARLGDLVIALVAASDPSELPADVSARFLHLVAQVDRGRMVRTISRRDVGLARRQVDILIAEPRNDLVFQDICDGALADVHFPDLLDPVEPGLGLAGGAAGGGELAVQFEQLLFADEPARAAGRYVRSAEVDNVVLFLELQDGAIGCRRLRLQLVDPVLQPGACAGDCLVFCAELVVDIGLRDRVGDLGRGLGATRRV
ncbi:hypothetical protein ACVWZR_000565 [Bradyrhizobium sp. i1.3.1]